MTRDVYVGEAKCNKRGASGNSVIVHPILQAWQQDRVAQLRRLTQVSPNLYTSPNNALRGWMFGPLSVLRVD
jgi:hypothetical protein